MHTLVYEPGGLIHERPNLASGWNVYAAELDHLWVGRVESYYVGARGGVRWRSMDTRYEDYRQDYRSRDSAAQELVAGSPRVLEVIATRRERMRVAAGQQPA